MKKEQIIIFCLIFLSLILKVSTSDYDLDEDIDEFEMLSTKTLKISVDGANSNEWWFQLIASEVHTVSSIQVTSPSNFMLTPPSWDSNNQYFVGKPSSAVNFGSTVAFLVNLKSGESHTLSFTYLKTATTQFTYTSSGGQTNQPSSSSPEIQKVISQIANFHESGSSPTAQITGEDSLRKNNKIALNNAMEQLGLRDLKAKSLLFALFGLESEQMYNHDGTAQRDSSKDNQGLSKNVSPLNMNIDMLNVIGFKGNPNDLNYISNIKQTVSVAIQAINYLGMSGFLNFHRGGRSGYNDPAKYDSIYKMPDFRRGAYNIMVKYMNDPSLFTDGRKVWANIPYV
jgi:hypothetical protein